MQWINMTPNVRQVAARPRRSLARSHAFALTTSQGLLLVEPAHEGEDEAAYWIGWVRKHRPRAILLTHHHIDHTHGVETIQDATGCEVWAPPRGEPTRFTPHQPYRITRELREGDDLGGWRVLNTPGHEHHHVIFARGGVLVAGDVLVPGLGWHHEFVASLRRLIALDPELVLSAHGLPSLEHSFAPWARWRLGEEDVEAMRREPGHA